MYQLYKKSKKVHVNITLHVLKILDIGNKKIPEVLTIKLHLLKLFTNFIYKFRYRT